MAPGARGLEIQAVSKENWVDADHSGPRERFLDDTVRVTSALAMIDPGFSERNRLEHCAQGAFPCRASAVWWAAAKAEQDRDSQKSRATALGAVQTRLSTAGGPLQPA